MPSSSPMTTEHKEEKGMEEKEMEREALITLFTAGAEQWINNGTSHCNWGSYHGGCNEGGVVHQGEGVCCNEDGFVYHIWLAQEGLHGSIPAEVGMISKLKQLWLFNNDITGSIPTEVGVLSKLEYLWLSENDIMGSIPTEV
eukprot:15353214-Ditylum_brightwellii.AAC.1